MLWTKKKRKFLNLVEILLRCFLICTQFPKIENKNIWTAPVRFVLLSVSKPSRSFLIKLKKLSIFGNERLNGRADAVFPRLITRFRSNEFERETEGDSKEWARIGSKFEADLRGRVITITDNRTVAGHRPSRHQTNAPGKEAIGKPAPECCHPSGTTSDDWQNSSRAMTMMILFFSFLFFHFLITLMLPLTIPIFSSLTRRNHFRIDDYEMVGNRTK